MALNIGNKVYRNLQEQVGFNSEQIDKIFSILDGIDYEDNVVVINDISTPLTIEELEIVNRPYSFLVYQDRIYFKKGADTDYIYFDSVLKIENADVIQLKDFGIKVDIRSGELTEDNDFANTYSCDAIDEIVSDLGNLEPSGVDTSANILAFDEDKGIWIGSDTGNWYYWNGAQYVSGGIYQATAIADGSIVEKDTVFFDADVSINRLNLHADDIETGKGIATDGTINANANLTTSGKMRAKAGDILYLARNNGTPNQMELLANSQYPLVAYNDQDSALLVSTSGTITCPIGTAYVRTCWWTTIGESRQWEVTLNVYPDKYYPYYDDKYTLKSKYIIKTIDDEIKNFVNCDKNIVLPSYGLYVVEGDTLNVFYDNVIQYGQADRLNIYQQAKGNWNQLPRFQKSIPTLTPDYYQNYFIVSDMYPNYPKKDNDVYCNTRLTVVSANAGSGLTKKCLFIGDSMTASNVFTEKLVDLFALDVMNIQLIGTLGTTKAPSEGRGGWRAWNYAFEPDASSDGMSPSVTNPFYDSNTGEFNFSMYMSDNGYSGLDYVFICLGTNDISRSTHTSKSDILLAYNTIIDSIKAYDSNIKVVLWLLPMPCQLTNEQYKKNIFLNMKKYLIEEYDNNTARTNGIFLVDVGATLDCLNQFNYTTQNISDYDSEEIRIPTDIIHPSTNGYYEIAHTLFGMIKYLGSL